MSVALPIFLISGALWLFVSFLLVVIDMVNKPYSRFPRKAPGWPSIVFVGIPWLVLPVVILISAIFLIVGYI